MIEKIGRYLDIDANGYIIPDVSLEKIPAHWQELITEIVAFIEREDENETRAIYVRGSVPRGLAIDGVSDLDLIFIAKTQNITPKIKEFKNHLLKQFNFCTGIEWSIDDQVPENSYLSKLLKTQALHLWGDDPVKNTPAVKAGKNMVAHAYAFEKEWNEFRAEKFDKTQKELNKDILWMGKRILRTAFECASLKKPAFTRDLYFCYEFAASIYPEMQDAFYSVLGMTLKKDATSQEMLSVFTPAAEFIIAEIKKSGLVV